jgi:hypothetical protein
MEIRNYTANPVVRMLLCSIEKNIGSCALLARTACPWISRIHAPYQFFAVDPWPKIRHPRIRIPGWDAQINRPQDLRFITPNDL